MLNLLQIVAIVALAVATASPAQVHGHLEDIIEDARDDLDPPYIKDLMDDLAKELLLIAENRELRSAQEKLAWFLTMAAVVDVMLATAQEIAKVVVCSSDAVIATQAALERALKIALKAAQKAAGDVPLDITRERANGVFEEFFPWLDTYTGITAIIKEESTHEEEKKIAYRIAEWLVLNWLLDNIQSIVSSVYPTAHTFITFNTRPNPFADDRALYAFMREHFENLHEEVMFFFTPWLVPIIRPNVVPDSQYGVFMELVDFLVQRTRNIDRRMLVDDPWA